MILIVLKLHLFFTFELTIGEKMINIIVFEFIPEFDKVIQDIIINKQNFEYVAANGISKF